MAGCMQKALFVMQGGVRLVPRRCLSTSHTVLSNTFPKSGGFETSMGASGPLVDGPDYTFMDGRPTPLRTGQRKRAKNQREVTAKVLQLWKETKFAIDRHANQQREAEEERQRVINSKFKPKGQMLLKKQNSE